MIIKDSMILIHLAKITLLEKSCDYFRNVIIPQMVYDEAVGAGAGRLDAKIISSLIEKKKINVKKIKNNKLIKQANQYNIQGGEAEALALYWEENADFLATDDDNVRKKKIILNINMIGTPAIILKLYKENMIDKKKLEGSVTELRKIGWFSNSVLDKILLEGLK
jgi:predicted nucleic acid-binding protein